METKKYKSVINAEEDHLVSKSVKATRKITKKTLKITTKSDSCDSTEINETQSNNNFVKNDVKYAVTVAETSKINPIKSEGNDIVSTPDEGNINATKKKNKSKKSKKCEHDNQNISVKTSFNKFDALQKRNLIHVRSSDSCKAQEIFSNPQDEQQTNCRLCTKPVYKMEEVVVPFKTEKGIYHKTCLRCKECSKQLKFDSYQSHEGNLYCNIHFKSLLAPKIVEQTDDPRPRRTELIIRESQPTELPPDVVRASDKPDLGLDELHQLDVRSRFKAFENINQIKLEEEKLRMQQRPVVKRSTSVLEKYRLKSVDSANDAYNSKSNVYDDDELDEENEDADLMRSKRCTQKERPVGIGDAMNDIKIKFEKGTMLSKEERREERKQEIQSIRSRLFMGKQAKIKEMYQQAVAESGQGITSVGKQPDIEIGDAARSIKQRFENGEIFSDKGTRDNQCTNSNNGLSEDADLFESAISKKSRTIFMELDANTASKRELQKHIPVNLPSKSASQNFGLDNIDVDVVKCDTKPEDVKIETAELSQKFKFFETYRPNEGEKRRFRITPPREGVVKMPSPDSDAEQQNLNKNNSFNDNVLKKTQTTSTMLNKFREMEQNNSKAFETTGPRPLKCFTPPPEDRRAYYTDKSYSEEDDDEEDEDSDDDDYDDDVDDERAINKKIYALSLSNGDEALKEAQGAARAKQLRAKFEKWQANEIKRELIEGYVDIYSQQVSDDSTIETAKTIRERFENMTSCERKSPTGPRYQVNRFV